MREERDDAGFEAEKPKKEQNKDLELTSKQAQPWQFLSVQKLQYYCAQRSMDAYGVIRGSVSTSLPAWDLVWESY